ATALRLRIEERHVGEPPIRTSALVWCGEAAGVSAGDLLSRESEEGAGAVDHAIDVLCTVPAAGAGPAERVEAQRTQAGISTWAWRKARQKLGVRITKAGFHDGWIWKLPPEDDGSRRPSSSSRTSRGAAEAPAPNAEDDGPT